MTLSKTDDDAMRDRGLQTVSEIRDAPSLRVPDHDRDRYVEYHFASKNFIAEVAAKAMARSLIREPHRVVGKWDDYDKESEIHTRTYFCEPMEAA